MCLVAGGTAVGGGAVGGGAAAAGRKRVGRMEEEKACWWDGLQRMKERTLNKEKEHNMDHLEQFLERKTEKIVQTRVCALGSRLHATSDKKMIG